VPDGVELPPDDLIEGLEKALVKGEILDVHLVGAPEFLEAGVHGSEDGGLDAPHGRRHGDADVDHVRRGALQVCGGEDVEAGPEMETPDVEALHGTLGLGETGDHGVGAVREGVDGEKMALAEEAGDEGVRGGIGGAVGGEEEEGPDVGGVEAGGEEVGGESAGGEEEGGARGIKGGTSWTCSLAWRRRRIRALRGSGAERTRRHPPPAASPGGGCRCSWRRRAAAREASGKPEERTTSPPLGSSTRSDTTCSSNASIAAAAAAALRFSLLPGTRAITTMVGDAGLVLKWAVARGPSRPVNERRAHNHS